MHLLITGIKDGMMEFLISLLVIAIVLDIAALKWGCDSSDGINSPEWARRQNWKPFH